MYATSVPFSDLEGKEIHSIKQSKEEIVFDCVGGYTYRMCHHQDCCEDVSIDDIDGNLQDLVGEKIITAYESSNYQNLPKKSDYDDSYTWTFYIIRTNKVSLTIRWYGTSNGYYSESVDFEQIADPIQDKLPNKINWFFTRLSMIVDNMKTETASGKVSAEQGMANIRDEAERLRKVVLKSGK